MAKGTASEGIPVRKLYTGAEMPAIGLGTFGSDKYSAAQVAEAVYGAVRSGYRLIDCASVYQNEKEIGKAFAKLFSDGIVDREELFITGKVWNDMHGDGQVLRSCRKSTMMLLAVTLHNLPEGMAVGVALAGVLSGEAGMTLAGALTLSLGMAIQNFPEGAIISLPLKSEGGVSRWKAFLMGALSGAVEPLGAVLMLLLARFFLPVLPYLLAFAAGAMLYVVVEELIPEASQGGHSNLGTAGFAAGFVLMMILDVALG